MKMITFLFLTFLMIGCFLFTVNAESSQRPTQQFNKLFLSPFYTSSMNNNQNYTFTVSINPPDGVSSVKSAIINFDVWMTPTVTFNLWVNNQTCNNPTYVISTTYASAGRGVATFDCSNIITSAGTYSVILKPTQANTGSSTAWLDLTYMNNPAGEIKLHGTEYIPGDSGKLFLQFLDASNQPINNSACLIDLWYPNGSYFTDLSAMTYLKEGIYFYNFNVPNVVGVYPAAAQCYIPYQFSSITVPNVINETWETNTFTGGGGWASFGNTSTWDYYAASIYTNVSAGTGGCYQGNYCAGVVGSSGSTEFLERGFISPPNTQSLSICYAVKQQGFGSGDKMEIDVFDGTWHTLDFYDNTLTANTWYYHCHNISTLDGYKLDNSAVLFGVYAFSMVSPSKTFYIDSINISVKYANTTISNVTAYQVLRGSGEVHVSNLFSSLNNSINVNSNVTAIANAVWTRTDRNLTYYPDTMNYTKTAENVWNYSGTVNPTLLTQISQSTWNLFNSTYNFITLISNAVWTRSDRNLTYYPTQSDLTNYTKMAETVWSYNNRSLTLYLTNNITVQQIWAYENRTLTYYAQSDLTNYTKIVNDIWNASNRTLTDYNQTATNYTAISKNVWEYVNRTLTFYSVNNITPADIWNYQTRNLTNEYINNLSAQDIWNYINRTLTFYSVNNITPADVWSYVNRNLTYTPDVTNYTRIDQTVLAVNQTLFDKITSSTTAILFFLDDMNTSIISKILEVPSLVWSNTDRNLTYYPSQVDLTNYTKIAETTWNYNNRSLTLYLVNNLTAQDIWNYVDRNLTYTSDVTNYTLIESYFNTLLYDINQVPAEVWNYTTRNLTSESDMTNYTLIGEYFNTVLYDINQVPAEVWNYSTRNLTNEYINNISVEEIWSYVNRTLTFYSVNNITPQDVWDYANRSLTYYPPATEINYTLISDMVWSNLNRTLTSFEFDVVNETQVSEAVWTAINRTLTEYPDLVNETEISNAVWSNVNRSLTYYEVNNITTQAIWNYGDRNLTFYPAATEVNYTLISEMVWSNINRSLTSFEFDVVNETEVSLAVWEAINRTLTEYPDVVNYSKISEYVWTSLDRNLTYYEVNNISAQEIWEYINRTLTYYPTQSDLTNYTKIAETVWSYQDRNLTYYIVNNITPQDVWEYVNRSLTQDIANQVWTYNDRNLTYYQVINITSDDIWSYFNRTLTQDIAAQVWTYQDRNLTFYPAENNITSEEIWSYVNRTLTQDIPADVWVYANRTLTYYDVNNLSSSDIWSYPTRTLTYYPIVNVTNLTVNIDNAAVANAVWSYNGTVNNNILTQFADKIVCALSNLLNIDSNEWGVDIRTC